MTRVDFCSRFNAVAIRSIIRGFILDDAWDEITNFPFFPRASVLSCFRYRNKSFTRASIIEHVPLEGNSTNSPTPLENRRGEDASWIRRFSHEPPIFLRPQPGNPLGILLRPDSAGNAICAKPWCGSLNFLRWCLPYPPLLRSINSRTELLWNFKIGPLREKDFVRSEMENRWRGRFSLLDFRVECNDNVRNLPLKGICLPRGSLLITVALTIQRCSPFRK